MSSPGYFYTPEDQAQADALQRRQAYAKALARQGAGDPGNAPYGGLRNAGASIAAALIGKKAQDQEQELASSSGKKYSAALASLLGGNQAASSVTSPVPEQGPNVPGQPMPVPASVPASQPNSDIMSRLLATGNPALMAQFGPTFLQNQMSRADKAEDRAIDRQDKAMRPATAQEKAGLGIDPRTPGMIDAFGKFTPITDPNQITAYQAANIKHQNDMLGETRRHDQATEMGDVGGGLSDEAKINAAVRFNQTGVMPAFGMGKAARQDRLEVMNYAAKMASGKLTPEQLVQNIANYKANSSSLLQQTKQFNAIEQNANAAKNSANLALEAATKGGAGPLDSPVFNRWIQSGRAGMAGDQNVINLNNHLATFGEEYAKVMTGATGAAPATDSARAAAHARISSANNLPQLRGILSEMGREMGGRHYAARAQIEGIQNQLGGGQYKEPQGVQTESPASPSKSNSGSGQSKSVRFEDLP